MVDLERKERWMEGAPPREVEFPPGKYTTDYDNLPERFLAKRVNKVEWKSPGEARSGEAHLEKMMIE